MGYVLISCTGNNSVKYAKHDLYSTTMDKFMPFVYDHGIMITYYHDIIHNCEYQNFYYRDT